MDRIGMIRVAAIVGPTAVGKTAVSLEVAEALSAEIISADSMQIYRGMDIGTAKASSDEQARVRHHLIDLKDTSEDVTAAEYQSLARAAIEEISNRGNLPLLVGGSGLYLRAVIDDLDFPPRSSEVRAALEEESEEVGAEVMYERLKQIDPAAAAKIEPGNLRRTIRALEVIELTGEPFSTNDSFDRYESIYRVSIAGLRRPREDLYARIDRRVAEMIADGLIEEARGLGVGLSRTARQALGYRQILDAPDASVEELQGSIAQATRRFARRQSSWFRADPRVEWFEAAAPDLAATLVSFFRRTLTLPLQG
ncbi:MAG: tRNA (adenosine(37)-N6)-dimethylallyltransferase MiaA [Actinomycetota bacterium]